MRREEEKSPEPKAMTPRAVTVTEAATPVSPQQPSPQRASPPQPDDSLCFGVIEVKQGKDDGVSLISEPYYGDGVQARDTVGESVMSPEQGLYVYGMGRPRADTGADTTQAGGTIDGGRIFGEDATLEGLYSNEPSLQVTDYETAAHRRLRVVAPPGRLGIVVDNPRGALPAVHAIKESSPLHGEVRVGDLVLAVDNEDCAGMSAHTLSAFLNSRSQNPARTLLLARASRG